MPGTDSHVAVTPDSERARAFYGTNMSIRRRRGTRKRGVAPPLRKWEFLALTITDPLIGAVQALKLTGPRSGELHGEGGDAHAVFEIVF